MSLHYNIYEELIAYNKNLKIISLLADSKDQIKNRNDI